MKILNNIYKLLEDLILAINYSKIGIFCISMYNNEFKAIK